MKGQKTMINYNEYWLKNGYRALVKFCQERINNYPTINQSIKEALESGNLMSDECIYPAEIVRTKAKTTYGIHRAFANSVFKWEIDSNPHEFLCEFMPYIDDGVYTIQKDGIIFWITEEDYLEEIAEDD